MPLRDVRRLVLHRRPRPAGGHAARGRRRTGSAPSPALQPRGRHRPGARGTAGRPRVPAGVGRRRANDAGRARTRDIVFHVTCGTRAVVGTVLVPGRRPRGRPRHPVARAAAGRARTSTASNSAAGSTPPPSGGGRGATTRPGPTPRVEESASGDAVDLTISFVRGPLVTVSVKDNALTPKQLAELVPAEREGSVDEDLLEDSEARIEEYLRAQGYRDADALVRAAGRRRPAAHRLHGQVRAPLPRGGRALRGGRRGRRPPTSRPLMSLAEGQPFVQARLDADVRAHRSPRTGSAGSPTRPCRPAVEPVPGARTARRGPRRRGPADRRRAADPRLGGRGGRQPRADRRPT